MLAISLDTDCSVDHSVINMMLIIITIVVVVVLVVICIAICLCLCKCRKTERFTRTSSQGSDQKVQNNNEEDTHTPQKNTTTLSEHPRSSPTVSNVSGNKDTKTPLVLATLTNSPPKPKGNVKESSPVRPYSLTIDPDGAVICHGKYADKQVLSGVDDVNIHNIHRIIGPPGSRVTDIVVERNKNEERVSIKPKYKYDPRELCRLVQFIVEARYYKDIVDQYSKDENCYENVAFVGTDTDDCDHVMKTKLIKETETTLKQEAYEKSSQNFYNFFNSKRDIDTIDLHFLQTLNDEMEAVPSQVIRALESRLATLNDTPRLYLEIILGTECDIRNCVETYLYDTGHHYDVLNSDSILVTFREYLGPWPCMGDFYCTACENVWRSDSCQEGETQTCSICAKQCRPMKLRKNCAKATSV